MTQRSTIISILFLLLLIPLLATGATVINNPETGTGSTPILANVETFSAHVVSEPNLTVPPLPATPTEPSNPWHNYSNVCETFTVIQSEKAVRKEGRLMYPVSYRRNRYVRPQSDMDRTRDIIQLVAKEMGVEDPRFFVAQASHESSFNPEAIHILNPDLDANSTAWLRHSYNRSKELELEEQLAKASARSKEYWAIKGKLADLQLYKNNPHWTDRLVYDYIIPARESPDGHVFPMEAVPESHNVWQFGYGLYGMYAVGYVKNWDREAPPWILCSHQGVIATIVQVWAAREAQAECSSATDRDPEKYGTDGGSNRGVLRRMARGQCSAARLGPKWQSIMTTYQKNGWVKWDGSQSFGHKWPKWKMEKKRGKWVYLKDENGERIPSDREAILAHMLTKIEEAGLLRPQPLVRKLPSHCKHKGHENTPQCRGEQGQAPVVLTP